MKAIILFAVALGLAACGKPSTSQPSTAAPPETDALPREQQAAAPPTHNYVENEDGIYLYKTQLSQAEKESGVGAASFVGFRYLGVKDGLHFLQYEDTSIVATCGDPCAIIRKTVNGRVADRIQYNPNTVIGAAFQDAIAGQLNLYSQFKDPASTGSDREMFNQYDELNEKCRGGSGDEKSTWDACEARDALSGKLEKLGYCYGEFAEYGFQSGWAKCSGGTSPKPQL